MHGGKMNLKKMGIAILLSTFCILPTVGNADPYTFGNYSVGRWMDLDFDQRYSLVFQLRRAIRLGMKWGHRRAAKRGVVLTVGDEQLGYGCLLHASTGTIMDGILAIEKERPEIKDWGLFQAVAFVAILQCEDYGDSLDEFSLN